VKGVNFYGLKSEFIISGSDCGHVFVWDKHSQKVINYFYADDGGVVNVLEPHPHAPVLATSGLDSDIKVWMPLASESTTLAGLERLVRKNTKERQMDREEEPDVDSQMLWFLMQHLRRTARAQMREAALGRGDDDDDDDVNVFSSSDDNDDNDDDEESALNSVNQCRPS